MSELKSRIKKPIVGRLNLRMKPEEIRDNASILTLARATRIWIRSTLSIWPSAYARTLRSKRGRTICMSSLTVNSIEAFVESGCLDRSQLRSWNSD